jgi:tetratricopeptide (TPR) repeat protein
MAVSLCLFTLWAQTAAKEPQWQGQAEFDMYNAVQKESDAHRKLAAIDAWKQKFPHTEFQVQRLALYLNVYQQLNDFPKLIETLSAMLELNPRDLQVMNGIMFYAMQSNAPDAAGLEQAVKVAQAALANLDVKPAGVADGQWPAFRKNVEALAHTTLGWAAMNGKNADGAIQEFGKALQIDANMGKVDLMLATALASTKTPQNVSNALFYYARAANYDGEGSPLGPAARRQLDDYLLKAYKSYHGDDTGLDDLRKLARSQPNPPENFAILSAAQVEAQKQQELLARDPQLALWTTLKQTLTSENGQQFFDVNMKNAEVPGGAEGVQAFKGTVISAKPKSLEIGIGDSKTGEVTLDLDTAVSGKVEEGCEIEFSGVPTGFTAAPFHITFAVERAKIKGLKVQRTAVRKRS